MMPYSYLEMNKKSFLSSIIFAISYTHNDKMSRTMIYLQRVLTTPLIVDVHISQCS